VEVGVALPDPRCVMPSLAQEDLPRDSKILKALVRHNRMDVAGALYPCAGVYAVAGATGTIHKDDRVRLARARRPRPAATAGLHGHGSRGRPRLARDRYCNARGASIFASPFLTPAAEERERPRARDQRPAPLPHPSNRSTADLRARSSSKARVSSSIVDRPAMVRRRWVVRRRRAQERSWSRRPSQLLEAA
jgi:hypothetical protein